MDGPGWWKRWRSRRDATAVRGTDFRAMAENAADIVLYVDHELKSYYVSPSCQRVLGWTPAEMLGRGPHEFVFAEDLPIIFGAKERKLQGDTAPGTEVIRMKHKDGRLVWVEGNARAVPDPLSRQPGMLVITLRDIHQRKLDEERLRENATVDGLTRLANRLVFDEFLEREWSQALRSGRPLSLMLVDVDHFKQFNDLYGHQSGDDCLRAVARQLIEVARRNDLGARYGGDELALVLPDCGSATARRVAERIRAAVLALRIPHAQNPPGGGYVSVCIGGATFVGRGIHDRGGAQDLLPAADASLYRCKREGRNRFDLAILGDDPPG